MGPFPVRTLLLALGVLLLVVAAVIFLTVAWGRLGVGERAAILGAITALAAASVQVAHRRGLRATAESMAVLTLAFAILDALGAYAAGLWSVDTVPVLPYWAGATAVLAVLAALATMATPLATPRLAAVIVAQVPLPLLAAYGAGQVNRQTLVAGAVLGAHAAVLVPAVAYVRSRPSMRHAWWILAGCTPPVYVLALSFATHAAFDLPDTSGTPVRACLLLAGLAGLGVLAARLFADRRPVRESAAALAALALLLAAIAAAWPYAPDTWRFTTVAALSLAGVASLWVLPRGWRSGPGVVCALAPGAGTLVAAGWFAVAVLGPVSWVSEPWSATWQGSASHLFAPFAWWPANAETPVLAAIGTCAAGLLVRAFGYSHLTAQVVMAGGIVEAVLLPLTLSLPYPVAVLGEVVLGTGLVLAGLLLRRRPLRWVLFPGAVLLCSSLAWSLAAPRTTVVALGLACCGLAAAVRLAPAAAGGVAAALLAAAVLAESVALPRFLEVSWPMTGLALAVVASVVLLTGAVLPRRPDAVVSPPQLVAVAAYLAGTTLAATEWGTLATALAAGLLTALVTAARAGGVRHFAWAMASAVLLCAEAAALAGAAGAGPHVIGFAAAATATGVATGGMWISSRLVPAGRLVASVGAGIYVLGAALTVGSPGWLSLVLLIGAAGAGAVAVHPAGRFAGWLSGLLLATSSWVQLAEASVTVPEAYAAPEGVALLVSGYVRFRRELRLSSWVVYGPGLSLVLVPSLARAVTDPDLLRPLLLGVVALATLLVGARLRLQAPLLLGGFTLSIDALVQLAPYLAQVYDVVPRWVSIGLAGLLVLGVGATYERRLRDLRRLRDALTGMR